MDSVTVEYEVVVHEEEGSYWAEVTELPGCFASGETPDELDENLREAISLYLSSADSTAEVTHVESHGVSRTSRESFELCEQ